MYFPTDKLYILSKEAYKGKKQESSFEELKEWISKRFEIKAIYIQKEIDQKEGRLTLRLIVETNDDYNRMCVGGFGGYDKNKQREIEGKFKELFKYETETYIPSFFEKLFSSHPKKEIIWICYSVFENVAMADIDAKVSEKKRKLIKEKYTDQTIWEIHASSNSITIFFYQTAQIEQYKSEQKFQELKHEFFNLFKQEDDMGIYKEDKIDLRFDSKENFDKNYSSSWYHYYQ